LTDSCRSVAVQKGLLRRGYRYVVARFAIDPPTLVQLADESRSVHPSHRLVAPNSIRSEALDLLLQRVRSGALAEKAALELHERITGVKIRLLGDRVSRRTAWQIARDRDWSTLAEAEYLAVAKLQADALITANADLAAKATGIVPLASFTDLLAD
jgi:predicted nucleic acid-binding protein